MAILAPIVGRTLPCSPANATIIQQMGKKRMSDDSYIALSEMGNLTHNFWVICNLYFRYYSL